MDDALRLADALEELDGLFSSPGECGEAAATLRRQHAEIAALRAEVAAMNQRADEIHKWYDAVLDRAEKAEAEVERLRGALERIAKGRTAAWVSEEAYAALARKEQDHA